MLRVGITCPVFLTTIALVGRFPHCPISSLAGIQFLDKKTIAKTIDYLWDFGLLLEYHGSHGNFLLYLQMSILTSNTAEVIQFDQTLCPLGKLYRNSSQSSPSSRADSSRALVQLGY